MLTRFTDAYNDLMYDYTSDALIYACEIIYVHYVPVIKPLQIIIVCIIYIDIDITSNEKYLFAVSHALYHFLLACNHPHW